MRGRVVIAPASASAYEIIGRFGQSWGDSLDIGALGCLRFCTERAVKVQLTATFRQRQGGRDDRQASKRKRDGEACHRNLHPNGTRDRTILVLGYCDKYDITPSR